MPAIHRSWRDSSLIGQSTFGFGIPCWFLARNGTYNKWLIKPSYNIEEQYGKHVGKTLICNFAEKTRENIFIVHFDHPFVPTTVASFRCSVSMRFGYTPCISSHAYYCQTAITNRSGIINQPAWARVGGMTRGCVEGNIGFARFNCRISAPFVGRRGFFLLSSCVFYRHATAVVTRINSLSLLCGVQSIDHPPAFRWRTTLPKLTDDDEETSRRAIIRYENIQA